MINLSFNFRQKFLLFCQRLMGTAKFQHDKIFDVIMGIGGRILQALAMTYLPLPSSFRVLLQRMKGVKIGRNVFLGPGCYLDPTRPNLLEIEDDVSLAGRITILTHSEPTAPLREILGQSARLFAKVRIKRGTLVGVNSIILPGVTIGENCMVSAGSVVAKDVPPYTIVAGNPARVVGRIKSLQNSN